MLRAMFQRLFGRARWHDLTPEDLAQRLGAAHPPRVIDVREPDELRGELGQIVQAESVPLRTVASAAASWDRDRPIVCVCRSGGRSASAASTLIDMGFADVSNLVGGMLAWRRVYGSATTE